MLAAIEADELSCVVAKAVGLTRAYWGSQTAAAVQLRPAAVQLRPAANCTARCGEPWLRRQAVLCNLPMLVVQLLAGPVHCQSCGFVHSIDPAVQPGLLALGSLSCRSVPASRIC